MQKYPACKEYKIIGFFEDSQYLYKPQPQSIKSKVKSKESTELLSSKAYAFLMDKINSMERYMPGKTC